MPIVYGFQDPDYGWMVYPTIAELLSELQAEIEGTGFPGDTVTLEVKITEMSQEEIDALPIIDR